VQLANGKWISDNAFVAETDGQYSLSIGIQFSSYVVGNTYLAVTKNLTPLTDSSQTKWGCVSINSGYVALTVNLDLKAGDKLRIWSHVPSSVTLVSSEISLTLLQVKLPYIIANKGALVSNPAPGGVTFGDDGLLKMNIPSNSANMNGVYVNQITGELRTDSTRDKKFFAGSTGSTPAWHKWLTKTSGYLPDFSATLYGTSQGAANIGHRFVIDMAVFRPSGASLISDLTVILQRRAGLGTASLAVGYDSNDDLYLHTSGQYVSTVIELRGSMNLFTSYESVNGDLPSVTTQPAGWTVLASV
jgi:hypothetical protein